ncbi:MAG: hypothetical protein JXJ19_06795 [Elusimicrobia bacterium]|nr:hypothetical protein [Elusimicrobiota bacterium]
MAKADIGAGESSDAIYRLVEYLEGRKEINILTCGPSLDMFIYFLSDAMITARVITPNSREHPSVNTIMGSIEKHVNEYHGKDNLYVFCFPGSAEIDYFGLFENAVENSGRKSVEVKRFFQRDGRNIYRVCYIQ